MSVLLSREPLSKGAARIEAALRRFLVSRAWLDSNRNPKALLAYVDALTSLREAIDHEAGWDIAAAREGWVGA